MARESSVVEVMTPIISTSIWPPILERLRRTDTRSIWGLDPFMSWIPAVARKRCRSVANVVVDASPVVHHNLRSMGYARGSATTAPSRAMSPALPHEASSSESAAEAPLCLRACLRNCQPFNASEMASVSQSLQRALQCSQIRRSDFHWSRPWMAQHTDRGFSEHWRAFVGNSTSWLLSSDWAPPNR